MKIKTSELQDAALHWAVAMCEGIDHDTAAMNIMFGDDNGWFLAFSTDWAQGGPIIEREGINLFQRKGVAAKQGRAWLAYTDKYLEQAGRTPLIAAMRCYVASKLGDEVDVPKELL